MTVYDWLVVAIYLVISVAVGLYFTRRARSSKEDYLLAGRSLGWFVAGTSIVATTFSSDTPLFVSRITRETGIFENWWWWSGAIGQLAAVFFFARLWRRSEVTTDVEFVTKRYEPGFPTSALRLVRASFDGIFVNSMIVASVTLGMVKILSTILELDDHSLFTLPLIGGISGPVLVLVILSTFTLLYTTMAGLYGVVYTDVLQFVLAMIGCIVLAVVVYIDGSKGPGLLANLAAAPGFKPELLRFFPHFETFDLKSFAFFVYIGIIWWFSAPSGGFYVQRMLSTRNESEAAKSFLWYNFCQYVLRPWPWIIVGMLSLIYFPDLTGSDAERAYPAMVARFLPLGLKGMMVAALMAAYMSTVSTHLHLGVSYLINDVYEPYLVRNRSQKHYVFASQIAMLGLTVVAGVICFNLESITGVYRFLGVYWAGLGTILIARWYWWRVNAWAELTGLGASIFFVLALHTRIADAWLTGLCTAMGLMQPGADNPDLMTPRVVITLVVVTVAWLSVVLLTGHRAPSAKTIEFYRKLRVSGSGWAAVARASGIEPVRGEFGRSLISWLISMIWLFSLMIGIGKLVFHEWTAGLILLAVSLVSGEYLRRHMSRGGLSEVIERDLK